MQEDTNKEVENEVLPEEQTADVADTTADEEIAPTVDEVETTPEEEEEEQANDNLGEDETPEEEPVDDPSM